MGLDYTEMIIKIEDKFNLDEIDDRELYEVDTPRKLIDVIVSKMDSQSTETCVTLKRFNTLRKALIDEFGVERKLIRLDSQFIELIPNLSPREIWKRLETRLNFPSGLPSLLFPKIIKIFHRIVRYSLLVYVVYLSISKSLLMLLPILGILVLVLVESAYYHLQKRWGTYIDPKYQDVSSTLSIIEVPKGYNWSRNDIANEIRDMIIEDFMVPPEKYSEDANFFKDIGLD